MEQYLSLYDKYLHSHMSTLITESAKNCEVTSILGGRSVS